ncbi:MAG: PQQ-binding-like beta-propeller repeat protein [bacterium]
MKKIIYGIILLLVVIQVSNAQMVFVYEDNEDIVEVVGNWKTVNYDDCHGGSALYTRQGNGSEWVQWNFIVDYSGLYLIETYVRDYKYGKDTRWTLNTINGDTTVIVDEYYNPGWQLLGTFELTGNTSIRVSTYFESDSGDYVYADAIKLTSAMQLYVISGSLELNGQNQLAEAAITLEKHGVQEPIVSEIFNKSDRSFYFDNLTPGYYKLTCFAWGYDSLLVDSLEISENDINNLDLVLTQSLGETYSIGGILTFDDQSDTATCIVDLFSSQAGLFVSSDTVVHSESYSLLSIPNGVYRLQFKSDGYIDDLSTYNFLMVENADVLLDTMLLYAYFNFAWISDSHVGAGFTESGLQTVIQNINQSDEKLRFVIHTGDLTEKGLNTEINQYFSYMGACNVPVYSIPGNHDTKWTESGMETFKSRNNETTHFAFDYNGYHFVGLNSGIAMRGGGGYIDPAELSWLKENLDGIPEYTPVIACVHHPADAGGIYNNWKLLDLLKNYHTVFLLVGHGHSNRYYDFEKLPGAMGLDTYSASSGYNVVRISKKDITVATHYTGTGLANPWLTTPYLTEKQPEITFTDLVEFDKVTSSRSVNVHISETAISGRYEINNDTKTGVLNGSNNDWSLTLPFSGMANGYHTLTAWLKCANGQEYCRTIGYYIENGYPFCQWKYHTDSEIISSPAYDEKNAYFGTIDGKIYALSKEDGSEAWPPIQTGKTIFSSPYVYDGILYIGSSNGLLYAVSADSGKVLWTYDNSGTAILSAITGADTLIYFAANSKMIAIHAKTGKNIWNFNAGGTIECRPAIQGDRIIFGSWDTRLYCLNRFNGLLNWRWYEQSSFYYAPAACWPVATANKVFIADPARYLTAIDINTGATIWKSKAPETWESIGISERKDQVYVRSLDGNLYAFSTISNSQQLEWSAAVGYGWDSTPSMPIGVKGAVISGSKNGFVVSVAQSNGQIGWKYWVSHSYITTVTPIDGATVLAAALDGTIMLIKADPALTIDDQNSNQIPFQTRLLPAYPNPFNNQTTIRYTIKSGQDVTIQVYNLLGKKVNTFSIKHDNSGEYSWLWNGKDIYGKELSTGLYIIRMNSDGYNGSQKVLFLK